MKYSLDTLLSDGDNLSEEGRFHAIHLLNDAIMLYRTSHGWCKNTSYVDKDGAPLLKDIDITERDKHTRGACLLGIISIAGEQRRQLAATSVDDKLFTQSEWILGANKAISDAIKKWPEYLTKHMSKTPQQIGQVKSSFVACVNDCLEFETLSEDAIDVVIHLLEAAKLELGYNPQINDALAAELEEIVDTCFITSDVSPSNGTAESPVMEKVRG